MSDDDDNYWTRLPPCRSSSPSEWISKGRPSRGLKLDVILNIGTSELDTDVANEDYCSDNQVIEEATEWVSESDRESEETNPPSPCASELIGVWNASKSEITHEQSAPGDGGHANYEPKSSQPDSAKKETTTRVRAKNLTTD